MRNIYSVSLLAVVFSSVLFSAGQAKGADEQLSDKTIGSVDVAGHRVITRQEVLAQVRSRAGDIFDPNVAAEDAKRIAKLPGVQLSSLNTAVVEGKVKLTFVVVEMNLIRSITFVGNKKFKSKKLQKQLGFKLGDYLDTFLAADGVEVLTDFYHKKGFASVNVALDKQQMSYGKLVYEIDEGPRAKIASVRFRGNQELKTKHLKKIVETKTTRFLVLPRYYNVTDIDRDMTGLQSLYYERGFLDVDITAKEEFSSARDKVYITFDIDEGGAYTLEQVITIDNEHFDDERLRAELKLRPGQIYNQRMMDLGTENLLKLYRENGFIDVQVEQNRRFVAENKVALEYEIAEGKRFRIGMINITGNEQTQDQVIRQVLDEHDFQPGKWYNADIARGDGKGYVEKLIRRRAVTESAIITPSGQIPGQRDAQVHVIESQTGMVMVGAGVSSDRGVMGQIVFDQKNFDIRDWPESFGEFITGRAFKGAGQKLRIALEPGTEYSRYSINFTEPYFQNKPISLDVIGEIFEWERESYDENRTVGYVGFEKRYKNHWRRSLAFRAGNVDVDSIESDAPQEIKDIKGDNFIAGIKFGVARDLTDDKFNPSTGQHFNASYEQVGGDHTFGVLSGTQRWYRTVHKDLLERKTILAMKLHGATIVGDAPPFEKFYAGGSRSIRGFDYRGVSTRGLQTNVADPQREDPIGSDWIILGNAELIVPVVSDNLSALLFVDSGVIDSGGYRASIGTGIQIMLPHWFGPVPMRFEVAVPISKDDEDDTQFFSFSVGRLF